MHEVNILWLFLGIAVTVVFILAIFLASSSVV